MFCRLISVVYLGSNYANFLLGGRCGSWECNHDGAKRGSLSGYSSGDCDRGAEREENLHQ
jgi:hypothetical protein